MRARPDGQRLAEGRGGFPRWTAHRVEVPAAGWLVAAPGGGLLATGEDGALTVLTLRDRRLRLVRRHPGVAAAATPLVGVRLGSGRWGAAFVTPEGRLGRWVNGALSADDPGTPLSPLAHPAAVDVDGDGQDELLAVARDGALVLLGHLASAARVLARSPLAALPDARVAVAPAREAVLLTDPTERYRHAVLGDATEAGAVTTVAVEAAALRVRARWVAPAGSVLEDRGVVLADVDGDGHPEALVTRAYDDVGAAQLVLARGGDGLRVAAEGPPIGRAQRWQHTLGAADLDGDDEPEVVWLRTPHIGGVLEAARRRGRALRPVAAQRDVSSHAIGSRNLDQAAIADLDGDGRPEVVVPAGSRRALLGLTLGGSSFRETWRYPLGDAIASNVVVADLDGDGWLDLAVADRVQVHVVLSTTRLLGGDGDGRLGPSRPARP